MANIGFGIIDNDTDYQPSIIDELMSVAYIEKLTLKIKLQYFKQKYEQTVHHIKTNHKAEISNLINKQYEYINLIE